MGMPYRDYSAIAGYFRVDWRTETQFNGASSTPSGFLTSWGVSWRMRITSVSCGGFPRRWSRMFSPSVRIPPRGKPVQRGYCPTAGSDSGQVILGEWGP
jgi:hypothetical protein